MSQLSHLQMLRGLAASLVVVDHVMINIVDAGGLSRDALPYAFFTGMMGVVIFFVISGFLMVRTTTSVVGGPATALDFAWRRFLRIVPLYYIATLSKVFTAGLKGQFWPPIDIAKSLLFLPYLAPGETEMRPIVGQGWTLNYEMFFYALFALTLLLPRAWSVKALIAVMVGLVAAGSLLSPLMANLPPQTALEFWTNPVLLFFVSGMVIGMAETRFGPWSSGRFALPLSVGLLALAVVLFKVGGVGFPIPLGWQAIFGVLAIASVLVCIINRAPADNWVTKLLVASGSASFSTYLFHTRVLSVGYRAWDMLPEALRSPVPFIIVVVIAANLFGYLIYRLVELPIDKLLRRTVGRRRAKTQLVEAPSTP